MHIPVEHIEPELQGTERFGVIVELLNLLVRSGCIPPHERATVRKKLFDREIVMTTGVGFNIALPHATLHALPNTAVALGRSRSGIDFASLDRGPVKLVVLSIVPSFDDHLKFLRSCSASISGPKTFRAIMECSTAAEIAEILEHGPEQ